MMKKKVILGMSGGVDSSVAAHLLQKQGFEVVGMFMNCATEDVNWETSISWEEEEKTLREVCDKLGIKLIVKNTAKGYEEKVISKMFKDYEIGLTPNPDILCNNIGKFPLLYKTMEEEGADYIATGHYSRILRDKSGIHLLSGKDDKKDQSYFLVGVDKKYLEKVIFPIGELEKGEVRDIAKKLGFSNWDKRSSRGICYLGKIDMKKFLHSRIKESKGKIFDLSGEEIGEHNGSVFFTIGEAVADGKGTVLNKIGRKKYSQDKLYVCEKNGNNLVIGRREDYEGVDEFIIHDLKLLEEISKGNITARIRNLGEFHEGELTQRSGKYFFKFSKRMKDLAPGQFIVLYKDDMVLGGGEVRLN